MFVSQGALGLYVREAQFLLGIHRIIPADQSGTHLQLHAWLSMREATAQKAFPFAPMTSNDALHLPAIKNPLYGWLFCVKCRS